MRGSILQPVLSLTDYFCSEMLLTDEFLEISNYYFCSGPLRRHRRKSLSAPAHRRSLLLSWASACLSDEAKDAWN
jgi:hypothetical protein